MPRPLPLSLLLLLLLLLLFSCHVASSSETTNTIPSAMVFKNKPTGGALHSNNVAFVPLNGPPPPTPPGTVVPLSQDEKDAALLLHNQMRSEAGGRTMIRMKWDQGLADTLEAYLSKCEFEHDPALGTVDEGENLSGYGAPNHGPFGVFSQLWVNEKAIWRYPGCFTDYACGEHLTQMLWHDSSRVGCARVTCPANTSPFSPQVPWTFGGCRYAKAGNIYGQVPYVEGLCRSQGLAFATCPVWAPVCDSWNLCAVECTAAQTCSGHGRCSLDGDRCLCDAGYTGYACQTFTCEATVTCSGHGACNPDGTCLCALGWSGNDCSVPVCPSDCSLNGDCGNNAQCVCDPNRGPPDCRHCLSGFFGPTCNCGPGTCANGGSCDTNTGNCLCVGNWDPVSNCTRCKRGWGGATCTFDCTGAWRRRCRSARAACQAACTGANALQCVQDCNSTFDTCVYTCTPAVQPY